MYTCIRGSLGPVQMRVLVLKLSLHVKFRMIYIVTSFHMPSVMNWLQHKKFWESLKYCTCADKVWHIFSDILSKSKNVSAWAASKAKIISHNSNLNYMYGPILLSFKGILQYRYYMSLLRSTGQWKTKV